MNGGHVGCALVVRDGKLVGIFTERDVLRKVAGAKLDLTATPVEQVMTPNPDTLPATASIAFALREMSVEGYRHIPLVNADGSPEGVVSVRDIVTWLVEFLPATVLNLPPSPAISTTLDGG
jgi:CBS domain-containing protein